VFSRSRSEVFTGALGCRRFTSTWLERPSSVCLRSSWRSVCGSSGHEENRPVPQLRPCWLSSTSTTETASESHVVETVEEAEEILRELWFGWFEGIYNQDEDRIREVVATEEFLSAGIEAFDTLEFTSPPTPEAISFDDTELLEATAECIAIWTTGRVEFLGSNRENTGVDIVRRINNTWQILSTWLYKEDLWQADCESRL